MEMMIRMLVDLSNRFQATEDKQKEKAASPTVSPPTFFPNRRRAVRRQPSPTHEPDLFETMRQMVTVAKRL